jgi:CRISPR-associated protein (TIGR02584 family)
VNPPEPAHFHRRILLAVAGLSPQVITETIWALARRDPPFVPTEIHVLTTTEGAERLRLMLLDPSGPEPGGALAALGRELAYPELVELLGNDRIHTVQPAGDSALRDILTAADNVAAANAAVALLRAFTADTEAALHVSIAGGRKTLGFFAGYALSLFGRPQDRMSHVLVPEPFQSHPQFFFPPATPRVLFTRENRPVSTADAHVILAEIPFLRLREVMDPAALVGSLGFAEAVASLQERFAPARLVIDPHEQRIVAQGRPLRLPPAMAGFLLWLARLRRAGADLNCRQADPTGLLAAIGAFGTPATLAATRKALRHGLCPDYLAEKKSRLNKVVAATLGPAAAAYSVVTVGRRPLSRYRLATPPDAIFIAGESAARDEATPYA